MNVRWRTIWPDFVGRWRGMSALPIISCPGFLRVSALQGLCLKRLRNPWHSISGNHGDTASRYRTNQGSGEVGLSWLQEHPVAINNPTSDICRRVKEYPLIFALPDLTINLHYTLSATSLGRFSETCTRLARWAVSVVDICTRELQPSVIASSMLVNSKAFVWTRVS